MTFISYAQNFEDVMLNRALGHIENGFYIDVGAQDPVVESVTYAFYKRGWRGINIEPCEEYFDLLCEKRPEDTNLKIALSSSSGELRLFQFPNTGLTTASSVFAQKHTRQGYRCEEITVPCQSLDAVFQNHAVDEIHFLKIDVEGHEEEVLKGLSLDKFRPWILVIEATEPNCQTMNTQWEEGILGAGYELVYFDGLNNFYLSKERLELREKFCSPPNFFDNFKTYKEELLTAEVNDSRKQKDKDLDISDAEIARLHATIQDLSCCLENKCSEEGRLIGVVQTLSNELETHSYEIARLHIGIQALKKSWSWRLTAPLRWLKSRLSLYLHKSRAIMFRSKSWVYSSILSNEVLTLIVAQSLNKFPRLRYYFKSLLLRHMQLGGLVGSQELSNKFENLPLRAKWNYSRLLTLNGCKE